MQSKRELTYTALGCLLLLISVILLIDVLAQVPTRAQVAFVSRRDGNSEIYVMDIDGKNQRRLTTHPDNDTEPAWSPDGQRIAFTSYRDGNAEIYVVDVDGKNPQNLSKSSSWNGLFSQLV